MHTQREITGLGKEAGRQRTRPPGRSTTAGLNTEVHITGDTLIHGVALCVCLVTGARHTDQKKGRDEERGEREEGSGYGSAQAKQREGGRGRGQAGQGRHKFDK